MVKLVAFSGSARKASFNQKLAVAAVSAAEEAGAEVALVNLADFDMPLFNQDIEEASGMPEGARRFKQLLIESDGFLIASPEYNSAFSPLLKNAIDWASRASDGEAPGAAYKNKCAAIMSASPGALGGMRGLVFLRMLLGNLGVLVLPDQLTLSKAHEAFDQNENLVDERKREALSALTTRLVAVCSGS